MSVYPRNMLPCLQKSRSSASRDSANEKILVILEWIRQNSRIYTPIGTSWTPQILSSSIRPNQAALSRLLSCSATSVKRSRVFATRCSRSGCNDWWRVAGKNVASRIDTNSSQLRSLRRPLDGRYRCIVVWLTFSLLFAALLLPLLPFANLQPS
jgi:hypothetical protein